MIVFRLKRSTQRNKKDHIGAYGVLDVGYPVHTEECVRCAERKVRVIF